MVLSFDLLTFIFWLFVSSFIPGAILSFSLFKKDDFFCIEKLLMGFALGFILLPLIPFVLYLVAGVQFSHSIALLSVVLFYIVAIVFFVKNKAYENIPIPTDLLEFVKSKKFIISFILVILLLGSFLMRVGSYGPIFQELDPYYYTYPAQQLLVLGENPFNDQTAWYPELEVNHRIIPEISYLQAIWYSLYTNGGEYDNMLLSVIAGMYPPVAAALSIFFIYLFVSKTGKREWGLLAAGLAAFIPVFIYKLSAGEMEVQPYAFFSLMFFYAMYVISLKTKDIRFSILAGLGFLAVALGSSSQLLALASMMIFIVLQSVAYFIQKDNKEDFKFLLVSTAIVFLIGALLGSAILKDVFSLGEPKLTIIVPFAISLAGAGVLYYVKQRVPDQSTALMILAVLSLVGIIVFFATPLGDYVKSIGESGFGLSEYKRPLDRTIAEQGNAPSSFGNQMGFFADTYFEENRPAVVSTILWPIVAVFNVVGAGDMIGQAVALVFSYIMLIFSVIVNTVFTITVAILNFFLGTTVEFTGKANSFLLFWVFAFWVSLIYSLFRFVTKKEDNLYLLFFAIIMPPFLVGIIKAKYTIYAAVLLAVGIGFLFSRANEFFSSLGDSGLEKAAYTSLIVVALLLVSIQFVYNGLAPSLLWGATQPLYQNDPMALQAKFQDFCSKSGDPVVCAAANDPIGYADQGTNYQYDQRLCLLSLYSDYSFIQNNQGASPLEITAAYFRCQRISPYWTDSMEWLNENTPEGSVVISWWDYGHWINFFGDRNAVLRNEHRSHEMIGAVADGYLDATPEELKSYMKAHGSEYALFDIELVAGGGTLGGKYGALNYLSCAWNNETSVAQAPGQSVCEADHLWETIFISQTPCVISSLTNKSGYVAYKIYENGIYRSFYRGECISPQDQGTMNYCQQLIRAEPTYCVGQADLINGQPTTASYYLNETYPNGDLKLNKAILQFPYNLPASVHMGPVTSATLLYTEDILWLENGNLKSGYEDRKGKFYDSALYKAIFLNNLPGFEQVYSTSDGAVKIYKISE